MFTTLPEPKSKMGACMHYSIPRTFWLYLIANKGVAIGVILGICGFLRFGIVEEFFWSGFVGAVTLLSMEYVILSVLKLNRDFGNRFCKNRFELLLLVLIRCWHIVLIIVAFVMFGPMLLHDIKYILNTL